MYEIYIAIISFLVGAFAMFVYIAVSASLKEDKSNKVHFYVAREKNGVLSLWLGKPCRGEYYWLFNSCYNIVMGANKELKLYGLDIKDYDNLKWEDEPVEVFLNLED